jgi:hypothetical protein
MVQNLRAIYGPKLEQEISKADEYAAEKRLPFRMGQGYQKPLPLYGTPETATSAYLSSPSGRDAILLAQSEIDPKARNAREAMGLQLGKGTGYLPDTVRHEMSHAATIRGGGVEALDASLGKALGHQTPEYKRWMENKLHRPFRLYSDFDPGEAIPPLAALQHDMFRALGTRIETPEMYTDIMNKTDLLPTEKRKDLFSRMPQETQRFFAYREMLKRLDSDVEKLRHPRYYRPLIQQKLNQMRRQYPTWTDRAWRAKFEEMEQQHLKSLPPPNFRLELYDNFNKKHLPGIVYNQGAPIPGRV